MFKDESQVQIPTIRVVDADDEAMLTGARAFDDPASPSTSQRELAKESLEDDIDLDPQAHFLSPVQRYEAWDDSDDDDEDDGIEWDAGIMDFALFSEEQKRAKQHNQPLDAKWDDLISSQTSAYYRSVKRTNDETKEPEFLSRNSSGDSLPGLTPDASPQLGDDLEYHEEDEDEVEMITERPYRTVIVTPDSVKPTSGEPKPLANITEADSALESDEEDLPITFSLHRNKLRRRQSMPQPTPKLVRPGLRSGRTLSGKLHVWRRPTWDIWPVHEDVSGEERAEISDEERRGRA